MSVKAALQVGEGRRIVGPSNRDQARLIPNSGYRLCTRVGGTAQTAKVRTTPRTKVEKHELAAKVRSIRERNGCTALNE